MGQINLRKNIMVSGYFRIIVMFVSFLTGWISTRFLGVELKGQYSYLITISSFAWLLLDFGIHKTYPYLIRKQAERKGMLFTWSILQFVSEYIFISVLGLAFIPFFSAVLKFDFTPSIVVLIAGAISLTKLSLHMQMYYLGMDKIRQNSLYQIANSLSMLVLVLIGWLLFRASDRLIYVLVCYNLAMFVAVIGYTHTEILTRFWKGFKLKFILISYGMGFRVFLSSVFITLLIRFDIVLIKRFLDFKELGIYAVAANIVEMLQMAANLVGGLLLVKLSDIDDDIQRWQILKKVFIAFFAFLTVANLGFVLLGKPLLGLMYGVEFVPVYGVFLWLIPATFGLAFGSLFNTYLWSKGFPLVSVILPLLALLLNIGLNLVFIPTFGIKGAALATSIAYVLWFLLILLYEQILSKGRMLPHLVPLLRDIGDVARMLRESLPYPLRNKRGDK
ncbi:MAG: oligosaccharide flippase family protein [Candidatus Cloacimonadaceae bacterium]|nr:oligosaccharide flippase family protein [Candidatus Cloacimonadaceae bacterium]